MSAFSGEAASAENVAGGEHLVASGIEVHFEGVRALDDVDLQLEEGEILGLIGPNGSGKTTSLNVLSGFVRPQKGSVTLAGTDVTRWSPARRVRAGLTRTFQGARIFRGLSVLENVEVASLSRSSSRREARRKASEVLEIMGLSPLADLQGGAVSAGDERRIGIARAVATRPRFLLLDEPAAGLNDHESQGLVSTIRMLRDNYGCGVLLVEHDMRVIMGACQRLHVLDSGKTIKIGAPEEVRRDPAVIAAYFGESAGAS